MKKDKLKWVLVTLAILVLGVMVAAACTQGFTNPNPFGWLDEKEPAVEEENNGADDQNDPALSDGEQDENQTETPVDETVSA